MKRVCLPSMHRWQLSLKTHHLSLKNPLVYSGSKGLVCMSSQGSISGYATKFLACLNLRCSEPRDGFQYRFGQPFEQVPMTSTHLTESEGTQRHRKTGKHQSSVNPLRCITGQKGTTELFLSPSSMPVCSVDPQFVGLASAFLAGNIFLLCQKG